MVWAVSLLTLKLSPQGLTPGVIIIDLKPYVYKESKRVQILDGVPIEE